jgi:hypothetical protein
MRFSLYYRGELRAAGNNSNRASEKHQLRLNFHPQLKDLWTRTPLKTVADQFLDPAYELSCVKEVDGHRFASLICSRHHLLARLSITFLRPEEPGNLITEGGDIDNRMKTLLDALSVPKAGQLPTGFQPSGDEVPLHCLLEDDNLVSQLNIRVDRLLAPSNRKEVILLIDIDVSAIMATFKNSVFTG